MAGFFPASELPPDLRTVLEAALHEACKRGGVDITGRDTEIRCRIGSDGRLRYVDPTPRIPASVLERGFDETAG